MMKFSKIIVVVVLGLIAKSTEKKLLNLQPYISSKLPSFLIKNTKLNFQLRRSSSYEKNTIAILFHASRIATKECQNQFRMRAWNCSTAPEALSSLTLYGYRETAFLFAIHSAGLSYSLANACLMGLVKNCKCQEDPEPDNLLRDGKEPLIIKQDKCAAKSVNYGIEQSRQLLRNDREGDMRWLLDNHNKEAGRLALVSASVNNNEICRCIGPSSSCATKICVRELPRFQDVGALLMKKYKSAILVGIDNYGKTLIPGDNTIKEPTKDDILYIEESPDFCNKDLELGSLGTKSRVCIKDNPGPSGCDVLCCNRGYKTTDKNVQHRCRCQFTYCCNVTCQVCNKNVTTHTCN